jgi:hypothetical protein
LAPQNHHGRTIAGSIGRGVAAHRFRRGAASEAPRADERLTAATDFGGAADDPALQPVISSACTRKIAVPIGTLWPSRDISWILRRGRPPVRRLAFDLRPGMGACSPS